MKLLAIAAALALAAPAWAQQLTEVASFPHQVTGVTVARDGRIFVNFPRWNEDVPVSVAEVLPNGQMRPYPDARWNQWRNAAAATSPVEDQFVCVQSVVADERGNLWVLDPGAPNSEKVIKGAPKLVRIDLATNQVVQTIAFGEDVALQGSYLNDIRFTPDGRHAFITDSGARGAIVVVELGSGTAKRVLDGDPVTQVEKDVQVMADGRPLRRPDGRQPMFAVDGIALGTDGQLYFQALTGKTLYRVPAAELTRPDATEASIKAAVQTVAENRVPDGLLAARDGTLLITAPEENAVKTLGPSGAIETVIRDARLRWPDSLAEGPDGAIYVTSSRIMDNDWFKPDARPGVPTKLFRFRRR